MGNVYYKLQQYENALEAYNTAIQLDPKFANPWNGKGLTYIELEDHLTAYSCLNEALRRNIDLPTSWANHWILTHELDKLNETYLLLQEIRATCFYNPSYWNHLGNCLVILKKRDRVYRASDPMIQEIHRAYRRAKWLGFP